MTKPIDGEKRWVKRKGCKNCAKQWVVDGIDEDGEEYGRWFVVPMTPGKHFEYVSEVFDPKERTYLLNAYFDPDTNTLRFNQKGQDD
jgi:hypothetical protein